MGEKPTSKERLAAEERVEEAAERAEAAVDAVKDKLTDPIRKDR
jgi:hypothetical protein